MHYEERRGKGKYYFFSSINITIKNDDEVIYRQTNQRTGKKFTSYRLGDIF